MSARAICGAQAYASDTLALRQAVDDLLSDVGRIGQMTPLDHWEWARRLPEGEEPRQLPDTWSDAVEARSALDERELHHRRAAALRHWENRKRVLDPAWQAVLTSRFPVDEGYRAKPGGGWKRKARRPSGRCARFVLYAGGFWARCE